MITRTINLSDPGLFHESCRTASLILNEDADDGDFLFFDIETTGLSPKDSCIYLIGCICASESGPVMTQLFSEDPSEEAQLLDAFSKLCEHHPIPVHYNGTTFDVPFIIARAGLCGINMPDLSRQLDLYRVLKPLKSLLGLKSMRMKAVEEYLGIHREDMYDGGELIEAYIKYISLKKLNALKSASSGQSDENLASGPHSHRPISVFSDYSGLRVFGDFSCSELLRMLLLHNYEDVVNMLSLTGLLEVSLLVNGGFEAEDVRITETGVSALPPSVIFTIPVSNRTAGMIRTRILTRNRLTNGFNAITSGGDLIKIFAGISENNGIFELSFTINAVDTELKLFFPDYKNYYYLVFEDYAIHKSIGKFMDKERCVKCNSSNCYTRKSGLFLPVFEKKGGALADKAYLYRRSAPDKSLFMLAEDPAKNPEAAHIYLTQLLKALT